MTGDRDRLRSLEAVAQSSRYLECRRTRNRKVTVFRFDPLEASSIEPPDFTLLTTYRGQGMAFFLG